MNVTQYANLILNSPNIEDKLTDPSVITSFEGDFFEFTDLHTLLPKRSEKMMFSEIQSKFPKTNTLKLDERKSVALHFFANHELLAIEMMAAALLYLPIDQENKKRIRVGIIQTIKDEQKHFKMYRSRMNDFGVDFGDIPVNDFFWRQMQKMKTIQEYLAVMALTFESANLDFAKHYANIFRQVDDIKTAKVLDIVYQDEISHVAFGVTWLNKFKQDAKLWDFYQQSLPELVTPARAKGSVFDREGRQKAGLNNEFIDALKNYHDPFGVTNRKEWKK